MRVERVFWIATLSALSLFAGHQLEAQEESSPTLACYELARDETLLTSSESEALCRGAFTLGPVLCYMAADDRLFLNTDEMIRLCRCAKGIEPVTCFDRARRIAELTTAEGLAFCTPIVVEHLWPDCTPREY
jgi:hypothetical protein